VFERGQEIVSEVRVSTATGERYYLTTAKPVVNLLQQVVMVLCVSKDITHIRQTRAELQSALNLLGATLEATEQGIIVMDTHDKLKLWNRRFLDLWGLQPEWLQMDDLVLVRQQMASLLIDPGQMAHLAHLADAGAATDRFATVLLRFTDGRVIKRSSQPQKLGEQVVGRVWSYTDITELEQQKEALRDSETRFSLAVDGADQGIWDIHLSTGEMYHSPRMAGMLGYTQAELPPLLAAWEARIAPDMAAGFRATFNAHLKNPALPFEYVLPLRHRDGSVRSIQSRGRASLDAAGRAVRVTGTHTDITERLQAEQRLNETLALLNTTLAATDEGIIVVSTQDHLDLWNQRFLSLWGIDEALLQCQDIVAIRQQMATRTLDPLTYTASLTALYLQPQASTFDLLKMADGRVLRRVSHPQRMGGAVTGRVWSYADVTDLKRAEDSARAADLAKSEFLANMSHEIRTPMNGVVGMVDILQQTALSDEQRRMLEVVQCSAQDLLGILNDILDFAKIEAGKLALEPRATELHPLVSSAIQLMQPNASSQGVTLHSAIAAALPRWVLTDPTRLRQVLLNLLGNAIKFTADVIKRERQVSLTVQPVALADGAPGLQFCVADNGIGMDDEVVARLFAPFMQADASTARRFGGTGLGLSISQRLVTLLGGQIAVHSRLGEGATFTVTLPLQPARMPLPDAPTPLLPASGAVALLSLHILLAEDNPINVDVISQQLRLLGCHCSVALDGAQALTLWQAGHFDLLLTDCHMPVMDGFALARAIRQQEPPGTRLPIIAITANAMKGEAERCFAAGMDAYLTKPIRLHELAAQLARYPQARLPDAALPAPPNAALLDTAPPGRTHPGLAATVVAASVTPAATATASAPVVWRAETLGELVGPDLALQKRLLQKFLLAAGGHIDAILAATQAGQWGVAAGTAHTLKSAARSVGALQLGELCQHIETSGHAGLDTECQHATQQLSAVFEAARQCIAPLLD